MLNIEKVQAQMAACQELMDELVPAGVTPRWDSRTRQGNVSLETYNRWVELSNCLHLWESSLNFMKEGNMEDAQWCYSWPYDVCPNFVKEINAKAGL